MDTHTELAQVFDIGVYIVLFQYVACLQKGPPDQKFYILD